MDHTNARDANLLGTLSLAVAGRIETATESPLGPSAPAALSALDGFLGGEPIDALRETLGLTHSGAVRLVDRLEAAGLAERRPGPDGRTVAVALTPVGNAAAEGVRTAREEAIEQALVVLSADERATLSRLHERMLAGLDERPRVGPAPVPAVRRRRLRPPPGHLPGNSGKNGSRR